MKINKNILQGITLMGVLMFSSASFAQEETTETEEQKVESKTTFSGNADIYSKLGYKNGYTRYTKSEGSLELGMASIKIEHNTNKLKAVLDLGFGKRVEEFTYATAASIPTSKYIKEAYLSYEIKKDLTLTAGTFESHFGYERLNATENKNYSMSYAYSFGPLLNTGLKANYVVDEFNFMFGVTLPTNMRNTASTSHKTIIGQIGYTGDERSLYFGFNSGSHDGMLLNNGKPNANANVNISDFDLVFNQKITDKVDAGLNGRYSFRRKDEPNRKHNSWYSTAVYLDYNHKENFTFHYRGEVFGDAVFKKTTILSNTVSANYKVGNLTIIPEARLDFASTGTFQGAQINAYGLVAATYSF